MNTSRLITYKLLCILLGTLLLSACSQAPIRNADKPETIVSDNGEAKVEKIEQTSSLSNTTETPDSVVESDHSKTAGAITPEQANNDLWERVIAGFQIPEQDHPRITQQLKWYKRNPKHMERVCKRATPFLHDIVEVLEENNLPTELALVPVIESAFRPYSYSHGRAAGLWQFIPSTGKLMGLEQNDWYDGRRDIYASTRAAAKYFIYLNDMMKGDWLHSLAAYNAGPGHVFKAKKRNRKHQKNLDYWNLKLPKETMDYVPRLLAIKALVTDPELHNQVLCKIKNEPVIQAVELQGQLDLAIAADISNLSMDDIYAYNPGFNRWATPPNGPHRLILPISIVERFQAAEEQLPKTQRVRWREHRVKSGDTLSEIAEQYHSSIAELKRSNNLKNSRLRIGQRLKIPTANQANTAYRFSNKQRHQQRLAKATKTYTVQSGDSWWLIAKRHGISSQTLARRNGLSPRDTLRPGQKLVIERGTASKQSLSAATQKITYPVRRGDSLSTIANKFKVLVKDIVNWNQLSKNKYLQPGQKLVIYVDVRQQSTDS